MKKIGILGSGNVGQALALGFEKYGYAVMIGSRNPGKLDEWRKESGFKGETGSFEATAHFGDTLVLAVKGSAAEEVMRSTGEASHKEKTVIDTTNPIADAPPEHGVLKYFTSHDRSLMEELQDLFPHVHFVKAFSCIGSPLMVNPDFNGQRPSMFICGNNEKAKNEVSDILNQFGFEPEDMGPATAARAIEPLAMLWCIPGIQKNSWNHGFKLLKG